MQVEPLVLRNFTYKIRGVLQMKKEYGGIGLSNIL